MIRNGSINFLSKQSSALYWIPAFFGCLGFTWLSSSHAFFWDTIQLGSKHAHHYYEQNFSSLLLPIEIDSGHPPYFGMYLAACWKVFGKSLVVSHWAMFPFLMVLVFQWIRLGKRLVGRNLLPLFSLFLVMDPVLASQASLVSPDIVLSACFLLLLNNIYAEERRFKIVAVLGLGMVSTRGMMIALLIFVWEWLIVEKRADKTAWPQHFLHLIQPYLPGGLLAFSYLFYHYLATGWIGYHAESEWAPSFALADVRQFLKNIAVMGWRFLDFGRIFVVSGLGLFVLILWRSGGFKKGSIDPELRRIAALFLLLLVGLGFTFLTYAGLQQHRYLLPLFLLITILFFLLLKELPSDQWQTKYKNSLVALVAIGLLSGNLWIYPDRISQGWDSTLAHWPFYDLRSQMHEYLQAEGIPLDEIGTAFPEIGPRKFKDLTENMEGFKEKDLKMDQYILYSNIMNDFSDTELWRLQEEWILIHEVKSRGIRMTLYRRPE
ncbi:MAG: hypothetical protein KTR30_29760 [Saprospiraceae bacterium]|nr:hypothetical protein [Saprospiraceae bacterium]